MRRCGIYIIIFVSSAFTICKWNLWGIIIIIRHILWRKVFEGGVGVGAGGGCHPTWSMLINCRLGSVTQTQFVLRAFVSMLLQLFLRQVININNRQMLLFFRYLWGKLTLD